ncbi:putative MFS family arabinose efflux permease [Skermanella aerolata]|uniref:MFS transporter n=1 Tax=Skermanella aerolata TaxID=393310 RepID=UPI003D20C0F0
MTTETTDTAPSHKDFVLGRGLTFMMAAAAGIAVANIYYNQPMLAIIERDFAGSDTTGLIPTATQLGYAISLFLFLPLGDLMDRRRLIVVQFGILAFSLVLAAIAPTALLLVAASLLVGASATVAQQIVPLAATLAAPEKRGATIGTVMGGVLTGILLSRTVGGFVGSHFGWREMFWIAAPVALGASVVMAAVLPRTHPQSTIRYGKALMSLVEIWRNEPALRRSTILQAALFASFSAFWTILALRLEEPVFNLGADAAGLFGIVGAIGILAAPLAGKLADRRGPDLVICLGSLLTLGSWLLLGLWATIPGLVAGVVVLDFGVQSALVSNQHVIYSLRPEARSRLNTIFMSGMFIGGATGSAGATMVWNAFGWNGVSIFGALLAVFGILIWMATRRSAAVHQPQA